MERLLLRPGVTQDEIDDVTRELEWRLVNVMMPTEGQPGQLVYVNRARDAFIHLVEDQRLGVSYLAAPEGSTEDLERAEAALPSYDAEAIDAVLAEAADDAQVSHGLALLVMSSTAEPTETALHHLRGALAGGTPAVRTAALVAITYAPWPELKDDLQAAAVQDPEETIRLQAQQLLDALFPEGNHVR